MRRLYLFRHAKAEPHGARPDHERVLAKRGRVDAEAMGERLAERGDTPELVLCSTSRRTLETWELAAAAFRFLPTRARLDLAGWPETDIFEH